MSEAHRLVMPKLGQAMEYGAVAEWLIADGAVVRAGQPVVSVESDKATYEIEASVDGVLRQIAAVGDEVPVGEPLATIGEADARAPQGAYSLPTETGSSAAPAPLRATAAPVAQPAGARPMASPRAREAARAAGIDLAHVSAHRADGLIVAADVAPAHAAAHPMASPKARALAASLGVDLAAVAAHRADGLIVATDVEAAAAAFRACAGCRPTAWPARGARRRTSSR
jgi:pyruvate dehydrogenase E2 component (dihydrolipoamide acetyltransferase)